MILDERTEFSDEQFVTTGSTGSDEIDLGASIEHGPSNIDLTIVVHALSGTVAATLQESDDKASWSQVFEFGSLLLGHSGVRMPPTSKRYLRVLWTVTGSATVSAALTYARARRV